jgi:hypothetical protein
VANRIVFFWGLALTLVFVWSCEKIIGIESKRLAQVSDSGPPLNTCSAISPTGIGLRVANMIPMDQTIDICIRQSSGSFPKQPLLASSPASCLRGIAYSQYTVALAVSPGRYDIKVVPSGSDCTSDLPIVSDVNISGEESTTVVAFGPSLSNSDAKLTALLDANDRGSTIYVRFFNALNGAEAVQAGVTETAILPATIFTVIFPNVNFGSIAPAASDGPFPVDYRGYMVYPTDIPPGGLKIAASSIGTNKALVATSIPLSPSHHYTLFLEGQTSDSPYPPKLWSCDESITSQTFFAQCGDPRDLNVGIFHPNLTDLFTDYVKARTEPALDAIASASNDILCVTELYSQALRQSLKNKVSVAATGSVLFSDDFTPTSDSNLNTQSNVAPDWPDIACTGDSAVNLANLRDCLLALPCIVDVNDNPDASAPSHHFVVDGSAAVGCVSGYNDVLGCTEQLAPFIGGSTHDSDACYMCAITHLSSEESIEDMYAACTSSTGKKPHYVYSGSTGLAVLTRPSVTLAPGENPEVVLLPASSWNRAALRVPLRLQNNAVIDFWCANVRAPNKEIFLKNGGPYYGAASAGDALGGNSAEENLEIARLVAAINDRAGKLRRRALIASLTYTSPQIDDSKGNTLVTGLVTKNFKLFQDQTSWQELVAASWTPTCTFCGDNPLNDPTHNEWMLHLFGIGIGSDNAIETSRTFMEKNLDLELYTTTDGSKTAVPISQHYGIQSNVRISQ